MAPASSDIRRRMKAARELAGLTVTGLAERINSERLGAKALGSLERGERKTPPQPHELEAIAKACELPVEFFTIDFQRLVELGDHGPDLTFVTDDGRHVMVDVKTIEGKNVILEALAPHQSLADSIENLKREVATLRGDRDVDGTVIDPADVTETLIEGLEDEVPSRDEDDQSGRGSEPSSDATQEVPVRPRARGTRPA